MKVASILPLVYLDKTRDNSYHMALAQFVGVNEKYTNFFKARKAEGKFVIMDNGAAEGYQPTILELIPKIAHLMPSEVVLPDTLYDIRYTLINGEKAIFELEKVFPEHPFQIMAVPQGDNFEDWYDCLKEMMSWPIDTIGVSKFTTARFGADIRFKAVQLIAKENAKLKRPKQIHLLGCHNHPTEVYEIVRFFNKSQEVVRGVDSALPYIYSLDNKEVAKQLERPEYEMDFMRTERLPETFETLLDKNIKQWEGFCSGNVSDLRL